MLANLVSELSLQHGIYHCSISGNWQKLTFGEGSYKQQYITLCGLYPIFFIIQNVFTKLF